jgi:hypothetical protein
VPGIASGEAALIARCRCVQKNGRGNNKMDTKKEAEVAVAIATLLHLIKLMGAELVAGQHRDDVELLVKAIDSKLDTVQLPPGISASDSAEGMKLTRGLLAPVLAELRTRSEMARLRDRLDASQTNRTLQ